jgi:hypothetical protein
MKHERRLVPGVQPSRGGVFQDLLRLTVPALLSTPDVTRCRRLLVPIAGSAFPRDR